jgi:regulator of cell morphogenesis and NO signaling
METQLQPNVTSIDLISVDQSIGQIAIEVPGATAIFRRLKLDYCCGGQVSLQQAAAQKGLDANAVVAELSAFPSVHSLPAETDTERLIEQILTRYHAVHRVQLPELIRMATRVEIVHGDNPLVPAGLASLLETAEQELMLHMEKEESILFPLLRAGSNPFVVHPIAVMRTEHVQHGAMLEKIAELTCDMAPPEGACTTWRALYAGIRQLSDDLVNHIHLENNILFARFDGTLPTALECPS